MENRFDISFPLILKHDESFSIEFSVNDHDNSINFGNGVYYLCGDNGSGKTTFINMLALISGNIGKRVSHSGDIKYLGISYRGDNFTYIRAAEIREQYFCIFPQKAFFLPISTRDNYLFLNGSDKRKSLAFSSQESPDLLSGGQQQKLLIDIVLDEKKPVWFLDEPLTNMDLERRHYFWRSLDNAYSRSSKIIFFIDHWLDRAITMDKDFQHYCTLSATRQNLMKGKTPYIESQDINIYMNNSPEGFFKRQADIILEEISTKKRR
jgi:ABC-type multidrug transport system ATPase subunit